MRAEKSAVGAHNLQQQQQNQMVQKRLFVGGLVASVQEDELRRRFSKFGKINGVEMKLRQDNSHHNGDSGSASKRFAYIDMDSSDQDFHRCINTYNKTKWKGSELKLQPAKENFMDRLEKERETARLETVGDDAVPDVDPSSPPHSRLDDVAGIYHFHMRGAKPGTAIPGEKNWIVGKYGSVLPVMHVKSKDRKKIMTVDPSKYTHNVKRMKEETASKEDLAPDSLTWELNDRNSEMTKLRQGQFPSWKPAKKQKPQPAPVQVYIDSDMEEVPQSETIKYNSSVHRISGVVDGQTDMSKFDSDSETEEHISATVLPVKNNKKLSLNKDKNQRNDSNIKSRTTPLKQLKHKLGSESNDSTDTDDILSVCKKKPKISNNELKVSASAIPLKLQKFKGTSLMKDSLSCANNKSIGTSGKQPPTPFKGTSNLVDDSNKIINTDILKKHTFANQSETVKKQGIDAVHTWSEVHMNRSTITSPSQARKQATIVGISLTNEFSSGVENDVANQYPGVKGNIKNNVDDDNSDIEIKVDKLQKINKSNNFTHLKPVVKSDRKHVNTSRDSDSDFEAMIKTEMKTYNTAKPSIPTRTSGAITVSGKPDDGCSSGSDSDVELTSEDTDTSESDATSSSDGTENVIHSVKTRKKPSTVNNQVHESATDESDSDSDNSDDNTVSASSEKVIPVTHSSESDRSTESSDSDSESSATEDKAVSTNNRKVLSVTKSSESDSLAESSDSDSESSATEDKAVSTNNRKVLSVTKSSESDSLAESSDSDSESSTTDNNTVTTSNKKVLAFSDSSESNSSTESSDSDSDSSATEDKAVSTNNRKVLSVTKSSESDSLAESSDSNTGSGSSLLSNGTIDHRTNVKIVTQMNVSSSANSSSSEDVSSSEDDSNIERIVKKDVTKCNTNKETTHSEVNNSKSLKTNTPIVPSSQAIVAVLEVGKSTASGMKTSECREEADKKRQGSVLQRQREVLAQKTAVQKALANLDKDETPNKKIVFESDDDDDVTDTVAMAATSQASSSTGGQGEGVGKKHRSTLFASSSSEDSSDDDGDQDRFKLRPQFEGATGKQLMKLQSRFGNDERFKLDSRFMGSDDEPDEAVEPAVSMEDGERERSLKILQAVIGDKSVVTLPRDDKSRKTFKDSLHFDPTKVEHSQFEVKAVPKPAASKLDRRKSKAKQPIGAGDSEGTEVALPSVSKERFYEVSDSIKDIFTSKPTEDVDQAGGFSLLAAFGRKPDDSDDDDDVETAYSTSKPLNVPASHMSVDNRFHVDISDGEDCVDDPYIAATSSDKAKELVNPTVFAVATKRTKFFFMEDDERLKGGEMFYCKDDATTVRDKWSQQRPQLLESYRAKQKIARRKARSTLLRNTPSKRGGKRPHFH